MKITTFEQIEQAMVAVSRAGVTLSVYIYFVDGLLIDTGPARMAQRLRPLFSKWPIEQVLITHHHEDHTGLAHWLQQTKNVPIWMHAKGAEICKKGARLPFYRNVFWGKYEPFEADRVGRTIETENYTFEVIDTPGHAEDHVVLYNRENGWLFSGDLYVTPTPKSSFKFESIPEMIISLEKVLTYDFDTVFCAHKGIVKNGKEAIRNKLHYLLQYEEKVLTLYERGMTPREIQRELFPRRHPMHYLSFFENSPRHFIESILASEKQMSS